MAIDERKIEAYKYIVKRVELYMKEHDASVKIACAALQPKIPVSNYYYAKKQLKDYEEKKPKEDLATAIDKILKTENVAKTPSKIVNVVLNDKAYEIALEKIKNYPNLTLDVFCTIYLNDAITKSKVI